MEGMRRLVVLRTKPPVIFIREYMLAQALPAAQNLSPHCPISHPKCGGMGGRAPMIIHRP